LTFKRGTWNNSVTLKSGLEVTHSHPAGTAWFIVSLELV